jgi:hypothetical protein
MDGAEWLRAQLTSFSCTACGRGYTSSNIRVLAQREELFFVDLSCRGCGAQAVAIVTVQIDDAEPHLDVGDLAAEIEDDGDEGPPAVGAEDILDMHDFLRGFDGDFHGLFGSGQRGRDPGT